MAVCANLSLNKSQFYHILSRSSSLFRRIFNSMHYFWFQIVYSFCSIAGNAHTLSASLVECPVLRYFRSISCSLSIWSALIKENEQIFFHLFIENEKNAIYSISQAFVIELEIHFDEWYQLTWYWRKLWNITWNISILFWCGAFYMELDCFLFAILTLCPNQAILLNSS